MHIPSPAQLKSQFPLSSETAASIENHRLEIRKISTGNSPLWAIVAGPCSLHDEGSAMHYAHLLADLQNHVSSTCKLVMRAHIEKPRTCLGWKGLLYDPALDGSGDILQGLLLSRKILTSLCSFNIPLASEFLDPLAAPYFSDLISWGFIGARTSSSQIHRQLASQLPMPVGFKNGPDGNLEGAIQGAVAAQASHQFLSIDDTGKVQQTSTQGNLHSHIVLRGAEGSPNYAPASIESGLELSKQYGLQRRILIDCAHGNSLEKPWDQTRVCQNVLEQALGGNSHIMGIMLESHVKSGKQTLGSSTLDPFLSVTDPCISWEETKKLILSVHEQLLEAHLVCTAY